MHSRATLTATWANADEVQWSGPLAVPQSGTWRVMIEESEVYAPGAERISYVEILTSS